ncbi:hypothetical protein K4L06_07660 [Lysobacter sp. BMK333-48F3]|uniref:hypothetical protein n=1 Tax=Lysobacter sp. BMK333-48F3 TaxID=2867962 RepID=UPI001C8B8B63|nr:hypothetical protein [Lysobacter sp. BMK333-48F3]MBX9401187.1 hypothetical protein [Lysobacter sp. BMK333-48F3]
MRDSHRRATGLRPRFAQSLAWLALLCACSAPPSDRAGTSAPTAAAAAAAAQADRTAAASADRASHRREGQAATVSTAPAAAKAMARLTDDISAALKAHLHKLAARGQARDHLDIALLLPLIESDPPFDPSRRRDALVRARDLSEHRALVAWLEAIDCLGVDGCEPGPAIDRLQQIEPDNAAVWLLALDRAAPAAAGSQTDTAVLNRAAQASRYDDHLAGTSRETLRALQAVPWPPLDHHAETALRHMLEIPDSTPAAQLGPALVASYATAVGIQTFGRTFENCSPGVVLAPGSTRLAPCRAVMRLIADGDSLLAQAMGTTRMVLLTPDGPDAALWRERLRQSHWLRTNAAEISSPTLAWAIREHGEVPALRAELERRGRGDAPPGWLPEHPRGRALILTGRMPPIPTDRPPAGDGPTP